MNKIFGDLAVPYGFMSLEEMAQFLGIDQRSLSRMAQRGEIPSHKVQGIYRFNRAEVMEWLQRQMPDLHHQKLADMDAGITAHRKVDPEEALIMPLLRAEAITIDLGARTRKSVLKELTALAQRTELVYDGESVLEALIRREELCSTAVEGGLALPHPRRPLPYAVAEPILVVARTSNGIGFGAPDGRLTDLFFMTCSQDDHHHLHILARLCRMMHDDNMAHHIRAAHTPEEIITIMKQREAEVIADSL
ncbi:MAG: PTS sugar transporter subunit IIA [Sedimentisphaerales bacterium]|nr:PTS sugar transporter subunit IIA [Sedimentisphaerales bacterium]